MMGSDILFDNFLDNLIEEFILKPRKYIFEKDVAEEGDFVWLSFSIFGMIERCKVEIFS